MRVTIEQRNHKIFTRSRWFKIKKLIQMLQEHEQIKVAGLTPEDIHTLRSNLYQWQRRSFPRGIQIHVRKRYVLIFLKDGDPTEPRVTIEEKA